MPYMPFPPSWPVFTPRDKMASFLESYAELMDLTIWTSSAVTSAVPPSSAAAAADIPHLDHADEAADGDGGRWRVTVAREGTQPAEVTLRPAHVVFATGNSGEPRVPSLEGADSFGGEQIHSSQYVGGAAYAGRRCVVLGCNTSAHDIVQDLWEQGAASATMVQRSGGLVVSTDSLMTHALEHTYSETMIERGVDHERADLIATTVPYRLAEPRWKELTVSMRETDAALHARLVAAGFELDFGDDLTGVCRRRRASNLSLLSKPPTPAICRRPSE